jgi:hypothetical protein
MGTINTDSGGKKGPSQRRRLLSDKTDPRENRKPCKKEVEKATTVQTLIFDKAVFTRSEAVKWARSHGFKSNKVDTTKTSYRLRQRNPGDFQRGSFRTISLRRGVKAVIGRLKASKEKVSKSFWADLF